MQLRIAETIGAPREKAFALANDIDRAMEWLPAGVRIEKLTEGGVRVGMRYRETRRILGRDDVQVYEVTIHEPPVRCEVLAEGARGVFRFRIEFEEAGTGATRVTLTGSATRLGCAGVLLYPVVRGILRRHSEADLAGLKSWIERQP